MKISVLGSLAHDRIMDFPGYFKDRILPDRIHAMDVSFTVDTLAERRGGTAGNVAYTLALLGQQPELVASVGKDYRESLDALRAMGVSVDGVDVHDDILTACATIITDRSNNQITGFYEGAMKRTPRLQVKKIKDALFVIAACNPSDMLRYAADCKKAGIPLVVDPGQQVGSFSAPDLRVLIEGATFCTLNDYEHSVLLDTLKITEDDLLKLVDTLVVTYGGKGSLIKKGGQLWHIPACTIEKVVDPTGAGDAFRAGLITGFVSGCTFEQMGRLASTAASFVIETVGTQEHVFTRKEFSMRYHENYSEVCPLK